MSKKERRPMRFITFGNFKWVHWLVVSFFLLSGIIAMVIPSVLTGKVIVGAIIVGFIFFAFGVFCVLDHILFVHRMKRWEKLKNKSEEG